MERGKPEETRERGRDRNSPCLSFLISKPQRERGGRKERGIPYVNSCSVILTHRETDRQTDTDRQTERQAERQAEKYPVP